MSTPQLREQLERLASQLTSRIEGLAPSDPLRNWLLMEIDQLESAGKKEAGLEQVNAHMRAMKQVGQLLFEHCLQLQNPNTTPLTEEDNHISFLTMRAKLPANVLQIAKEKKFSIEPTLLFNKDWDNDSFDPVSPTAKIVGYLRSRDPSLQLADELVMDVQGQELLESLTELDEETVKLMGILFQSRHHAINAAITETKTSQVIELASGISPRGLQWAQSMPESLYVESDLPALMIHKAKLLRNHILASAEVNHGILHCCALNVLDSDGFSEILNSIDVSSPFVLVSEGLLLYFDEDELAIFLDNIAAILKKYSHATWVTDMVTKQSLCDLLESHPGVANAVRQVFSMTGRSVIKSNPFNTDQCVAEALQHRGLFVKSQKSLREMAAISLSSEMAGNGIEASGVLGERKIWSVATQQD